MKVCSKCGKTKDDSEFFWKNKENGILHSYCKECKRELDRKSYSSNSHDRKEKIRERQRKIQEELKEYVTKLKKESCCSICGESRWYVLDFHHLGGKEYTIAALIKRGCSINTLKEELAKCQLVCSNCHREIHYNEKHLK